MAGQIVHSFNTSVVHLFRDLHYRAVVNEPPPAAEQPAEPPGRSTALTCVTAIPSPGVCSTLLTVTYPVVVDTHPVARALAAVVVELAAVPAGITSADTGHVAPSETLLVLRAGLILADDSSFLESVLIVIAAVVGLVQEVSQCGRQGVPTLSA